MRERLTARVLVGHGNECVIEAPDGSLARCLTRRRTGRAVCGDRVEWLRTEKDAGTIERILPRRNALSRTNYRGQERILAANLDCLLVVLAPEPDPDAELVDRYLVLAHSLDVTPLLVVNKTDLLEERGEAARNDIISEWSALGYPHLATSARQGRGIDALVDWIGERTAILVGQSGVGKSSLINALVPDRQARTQALSHASGQGRHTTTETTLYPLSGGGALMDSPGIRILRLAHLDPRTVADGFVEFRPYRDRCQYRDCLHREEPGCAVREAVNSGLINPRRLASFHTLVAETGNGRTTAPR